MRSQFQLTSTAILLSGAMALTGCGTRATSLHIDVTESLRTPAPDPAKPDLPPPSQRPYAATVQQERASTWAGYVKPLLGFSGDQEGTTAAERQRATGLLALIDDFNERQRKKRWRLPWIR